MSAPGRRIFPVVYCVHPGQLSLTIPPWAGAMSTSECRDIKRHTARCTSPACIRGLAVETGVWLMKRGSAPLYGPDSGRTLRTYTASTTNVIIVLLVWILAFLYAMLCYVMLYDMVQI